MKYNDLLKRCYSFYKLALNAQDLTLQAITDPQAFAVLTDHLLSSGQILSPEESGYNEENFPSRETFQRIVRKRLRMTVAKWIKDQCITTEVKDLKPGDAVVEIDTSHEPPLVLKYVSSVRSLSTSERSQDIMDDPMNASDSKQRITFSEGPHDVVYPDDVYSVLPK